MRISDWSSDVCSSDLPSMIKRQAQAGYQPRQSAPSRCCTGAYIPPASGAFPYRRSWRAPNSASDAGGLWTPCADRCPAQFGHACHKDEGRSEEHTSELQSLMRISYAVFCFKKKNKIKKTTKKTHIPASNETMKHTHD